MSIFLDAHYARVDRQLLRKATKTRYAELLRLTGGFPEKPVETITRGDVEDALASAHANGAAPRTVKTLLAAIRATLRYAGSSAADGLRVKTSAPAIDVLSAAESERLRDALLVRSDDAAHALLILLGTGIRRGEAIGLRPDDWLADRRQLRIARGADGGPTKSGAARFVDVPDWLAERLDARGPAVRVSGRTMGRALDGACASAGVRRVKIHGLRHSRITHLLLSGAPALYVSEQAGHASPGFTLQVYGHMCGAAPEQRRTWANL